MDKAKRSKKINLQNALQSIKGIDETELPERREKEKETKPGTITDMPFNPRESPFFHPVFNPLGYPPPGQENYFQEKREAAERVQRVASQKAEQEEKERRRIEEVILAGMRPVQKADSDTSEEEQEYQGAIPWSTVSTGSTVFIQHKP